MGEVPIAPIERIIRKAGMERVSDDAKTMLRDAMMKYEKVSKEAIGMAKYANRKTVKAEDVDMAVNRIS